MPSDGPHHRMWRYFCPERCLEARPRPPPVIWRTHYALGVLATIYGVTVLCLLMAIPRFRQQRSLAATAA